MKIIRNILILAAVLLFPVFCFAQGSGSSEPPKSSGGGKTSAKKSNFAVTRSVSGVVNSIGANSISVKTANSKIAVFTIVKNSTFASGKPKKGDKVKITYTANNRRIVSVRRV